MTEILLRNGTHYRYNFKHAGPDRYTETWDLRRHIADWLTKHSLNFTKKIVDTPVLNPEGEPYLMDDGTPFTAPDVVLEFLRPQDAVLFKLTWC